MISQRLDALRGALQAEQLDGVFIPKMDMFRGEFLRACDERLEWISGFTGSAGHAVITRDRALLFVDGRYTLQARQQCPDFEVIEWPNQDMSAFVKGLKIGFDPDLISAEQYLNLRKTVEMKPLRENLLDGIWHDRPVPRSFAIRTLPEELTGLSSEAKRAEIAEALRAAGVDYFVTNLPENTAWLLNIRGGEIESVPAPHWLCLISKTGEITLYGDLADDAAHFSVAPIAALKADLGAIDAPIGCDLASLPKSIYDAIRKPKAISDPLLARKARKTDAEIKASQSAHERDAVAMIRMWKWLEAQPPSALDELSVIAKLAEFRKQAGSTAPSFETIAGFNANGAIVHYRASEKSNLAFSENGILLLDSGGHYPGATTDITRTFAIGGGNEAAKPAFTAVLNGLAAISQAKFPKGKAGRDIDNLARAPLWQQELDYGHGTGHGVGAEISVHEGPQAISSRNSTPLEAGMIVSLEPGFYAEGEYGIRLENLAVIRENGDWLSFETLSFVPFDKTLIARNHLDASTISWLNAYHQACFDKISPYLDPEEREFLAAKCREGEAFM